MHFFSLRIKQLEEWAHLSVLESVRFSRITTNRIKRFILVSGTYSYRKTKGGWIQFCLTKSTWLYFTDKYQPFCASQQSLTQDVFIICDSPFMKFNLFNQPGVYPEKKDLSNFSVIFGGRTAEQTQTLLLNRAINCKMGFLPFVWWNGTAYLSSFVWVGVNTFNQTWIHKPSTFFFYDVTINRP